MWLGVLGPVSCQVDGEDLPIGGPLNRALLAALAVSPSASTSVDALVDALWGSAPPRAASKIIRNRVSDLRKRLADGYLDTTDGGYRLGRRVEVDVATFELDGRLPAEERLAVWRGEPFSELPDWLPARIARARLTDLRLVLEEQAAEEALASGDARRAISSLLGLVEAEPFRERRWALLMKALYTDNRQRDALLTFQRARRILNDELGLDPSDELVDLEQAMLLHDASLRAPTDLNGGRALIHDARRLIGRGADI